MPVADGLRRRETDAVYQAGVHQFVGEYQRMRIRHRRQDACVRMITAAERQGTFAPEPSGKQSLQLTVRREVARQQSRGGSRKQPVALRHAPPELVLQGGIGSQPQVIVRREVQHPPPVLPNPYSVVPCFGQRAQVAFLLQCV